MWTYEDAGLGYSSFAVVGETLFTMGADATNDLLIAVDTTTGKLLDEYDSQASKIESAINQVDMTRTDLPSQPNDHSHVVMEQMIEDRRDEVLKSWQTLYDRQILLECTHDHSHRYCRRISGQLYATTPPPHGFHKSSTSHLLDNFFEMGTRDVVGLGNLRRRTLPTGCNSKEKQNTYGVVGVEC